MITRHLHILFLISLTLLTFSVWGQTDKLVNISYDPHADSVFFEQMQQRMEQIRKTEKRPTVALVLAGGGAKGAAHIGVLRFIEEKGIPIDFVAGTSMGGLLGGLYAMGYSVNEIDSIVRSIDWNVMMSDEIPMDYYTYTRKMYKNTYLIDIPFTKFEFLNSLPSGFKYGLNIYNMISALTVGYQQDMSFLEFPTPYCCVATEIVSQTEKHWTSGSMIDAMRSTMSIPGYFRPVRVDSMILSDGGTKNNFPTDIAVAAGADIIIGVEMSIPRDYERVNNIADVLMQTAQYSGGLEAHNRNVKNATLYITPNISGFNTMSFGTKEISTLIGRGYMEAVKHEREFDSIAGIVGTGARKLQNAKAINTADTKVLITEVAYEGVSPEEEKYIDGKVRLKLNEYYDKSVLELSQAIIYGTMAFSQVTYRLEPDGAGYRLVFDCEKRPTNSFGIGVRADSQEWFSVILNAGLGRNKIFGSLFDATVRLSMSPYLKLEWYYLPKKGPKFGIAGKTLYRTLLGTEDHEYDFQFFEQLWHNEAKVYIADTRWSQVNLSVGARIEYMPYHKIIRPMTDSVVSNYWNWKNYHPYVYMRFTYDHENTRYFPERGIRVTANYDYNLHKTHFASAGFHGVIPVCKWFSILASANGRYIFGEENTNPYMDNFVGGIIPGRYYDQQIAFIGYNSASPRKRLLTMADLDFRFRFARKYYLSLVGAVLHDGESIRRMSPHPVYAAGLQFGYKSKFGPLMANLHWNSAFNKIGFYISVGYDF